MISAAQIYQRLPQQRKLCLTKDIACGRRVLNNHSSIQKQGLPNFMNESYLQLSATDAAPKDLSSITSVFKKHSDIGTWWLLGEYLPVELCPKAKNEMCFEFTGNEISTLDGQLFIFECLFRYFKHEPREHRYKGCPLGQLCSQAMVTTARRISLTLAYWLSSVNSFEIDAKRESHKKLLTELIGIALNDSNIKSCIYAIKFIAKTQ
jgi:hypothetical protein